MKKILINDYRLTSNMNCVRSEKAQLFRRKGLDNKFTTKETCDVCGGEYSIDVEYTRTYTTKVIDKRVTL